MQTDFERDRFDKKILADYKSYRNNRLIWAGGGTALFMYHHNETNQNYYINLKVTTTEVQINVKDSIIILYSYKNQYQSKVIIIKKLFDKWLVTVNLTKIVKVMFCSRRKKAFAVDNLVKIKIYNKFIDCKNTAKYLKF